MKPARAWIPCLIASSLAGAALGAAAMAAPPRTAHDPNAAGLLATEQAWVEALEHRDLAKLERILADEFVDSTWEGALHTRGQNLREMDHRARDSMILSDLSARTYGRVGIVHGVNTVSDGHGSVHVRFTDVFIYRGGAWRAISAQETLVRQRVAKRD